MNCTIGQILKEDLLSRDQDNWPNYVAVIEMSINSTSNASIYKAPFGILYGENILLPRLIIFHKSFPQPSRSEIRYQDNKASLQN